MGWAQTDSMISQDDGRGKEDHPGRNIRPGPWAANSFVDVLLCLQPFDQAFDR